MSHLTISGKLLAAALITSFCASAAMAETTWQQNHPRRTEVNSRLNNQNARINAKVANGTMSQAKATRLKTADQGIRQEERTMAAQNGGHITGTEQKALNQQENAVSNRIAK